MPDRLVEVLEAVLAEVAQPDAVDEVAGRAREDHLPAVAGGRDPRAEVDVEADVALVGARGRAGVDAHPHANRAAVERRAAQRPPRRPPRRASANA